MKRDSFIFYRSFMEGLNCFDDKTRLNVYDAILSYALDGEETELSGESRGLFSLIKPQIDANNKRYVNGQKGAAFGKLGGRPKNPEGVIDKNPTGVSEKVVKKTPNENVNENVNVNDKKDNVGKPDTFDRDIKEIVDYLNQKTQSNFKPKTEETRKSIRARLKEGYTVDDFKRVIDSKSSDWADSERMREYLRPSTLFRPANFEAYLNEANRPKVKKKAEFLSNEYDFDELERQLMKN